MNRKTQKAITGLHIVGQIMTNADTKARSEKMFKPFLSSLIQKYRLQELGCFYYKFGETGGFTGVICLTESHVAIHTWPELKYITLDVFLCNYSRNNEEACRELFFEICDYFTPLSVSKEEIFR